MATDRTPPIRGFKTTLSVIGVAYVFLASTMIGRGAAAAMQPFGVPEPVLSSPHYADYFHFTFVHMAVLGILIAMLGRFVTDGGHQRLIAIVLCAINLHYTYLDFRTSDSMFGNALYRGPASVAPAIIDVVVTLAFVWLIARGTRVSSARLAG